MDEVYVYSCNVSGAFLFLKFEWLWSQLDLARVTVGPGSFDFRSLQTHCGSLLKHFVVILFDCCGEQRNPLHIPLYEGVLGLQGLLIISDGVSSIPFLLDRQFSVAS